MVTGEGTTREDFQARRGDRTTSVLKQPLLIFSTLIFSQNNEITDDGAHKLIDGIKAHHVTCVRIHGRERGPEAWLQHIYFSKNPMTDEAREAIMAAMLWMPPPPKEDVMEEEAMSSIKSSIKPTEEEEKQEDENEKCCCGFCAPMFGLSCC